MDAIGDAAAPYRTREARRDVVAQRFRSDRDCWLVTAHPDGGPHIVPLSFLVAGSVVVLATGEQRRAVRNVTATPRAAFALGGYGDAIRAHGTCEVHAFDSISPAIRASYVAKAGWDPAVQPARFVALLLHLEEVACSRSPAEDKDRVVWRKGERVPW
jgi:Pyridoxamine 5'-phosphate oxidase